MLMEMVDEWQQSLKERQTAVARTVGPELAKHVSDQANDEQRRYSGAPYVVEDSEDALLLVRADGSYGYLAPEFMLTEDCMRPDENEDCYTIDGPADDLLRFVPVDADYEFPLVDKPATVTIPTQLAEMSDALFEDCLAEVVAGSGPRIAQHLLQLQRMVEDQASEPGSMLEQMMQSPEFIASLASVFTQAMAASAGAMSEHFLNAAGIDDEDFED